MLSVFPVQSLMRAGFAAPLVLAAACWGLATVITKSLLSHIPPLALLAVQLAASITFLWALVAARRKRIALDRESLRQSLIGLLNPGLAYTFGLLGLTMTSASLSTLLWAAEPILILGLAWLVLKERVSGPLLGLSAIAVTGVLLIAGSQSSTPGSPAGNLLVLAGVLCCALYTVFTRQIAKHADPLLAVALQQTGALGWALAIWPFELVWGDGMRKASISLNIWLWALGAGVMYYAAAFWFYIVGLKNAPASIAGSFLNLIPIFGVGGAHLFLGERLSAVQWMGAALIVGAVFGIVGRHGEERVAYVQG